MKTLICPACGGNMKRNGKTSAGTTRWRCKSCGASTTQNYSKDKTYFTLFLKWLLSKHSQKECGMSARTFRDKTSKYWDIWPMAPLCDEVHHVIEVDGIWLKRSVVILIATTPDHVVGWHLARSESSQAWIALLSRIAPPDVVVTDGGQGFEKAKEIVWSTTKVQRCVFHAFCQVKRCTTTRPKLQAGVELYRIAKDLLRIKSQNEAAEWLATFANWCSKWDQFLREKEYIDGGSRYKHERLRKARRGLVKLCKQRTLFTYLDDALLKNGPVPATTNYIEGGVNAQLRTMLKEHRGLRLSRQIKAVFWWCYFHLENPLEVEDILREMPTDDTISEIYAKASEISEKDELIERWGTAIQWSDLHFRDSYFGNYE